MRHRFSTLDYSLALERVGGDEALLREIAQLFLDEYPELMQSLKKAVTDGQAEEVYRAAHTLKGSLGTLAAETAFQCALRLETMGRQRDLAEAAAGLSSLAESLAKLDAELRKMDR